MTPSLFWINRVAACLLDLCILFLWTRTSEAQTPSSQQQMGASTDSLQAQHGVFSSSFLQSSVST